jgi:DNA-binding XRE family transcriptional regulator
MEQLIEQPFDFVYNWLMNHKDHEQIDFPSICKEVRAKLGLTQKLMAERLGVTLRSYQRYESGEMKPGAEAAFRLAEMDMELRLKRLK